MPLTVITGATTGVGLEIAIGLAHAGHSLILGARDAERGHRAVEAIHRVAPAARVEHRPLDLAELASVRAFADGLPVDAIDRLVLNAAVMTVKRRETADGFEAMLGTNALGHHALVTGLLDRLLATPASRLITQSSESHRRGALDFSDLQHEQSFDPIQSYHDSKLAQHVLAVELDRRIPRRSVVAQPGWVASELGRDVVANGRSGHRAAVRIGNRLLGQTPAQGARAALRATLDDDAPGAATGRYLTPGRLGRLRGTPVVDLAKPTVLEPDLGRRMWETAERLTAAPAAVR